MDQRLPLPVDQRRHDPFRVELLVGGLELIAGEQIERDLLASQPLQAERDAHAERGLRAPIGEEFHASLELRVPGATHTTSYFHPFIGHSNFAVARSSGQTDLYSLPCNWIR